MRACCPGLSSRVKKKGFFHCRTGRSKRIQRYFCKRCETSFSDRTMSPHFRQKKPHVNLRLYRLLANGISQRGCAEILGIHRTTVARKVIAIGFACREKNAKTNVRKPPTSTVVFDEMETFEHSKCKPLSIAVAVEEKTRHILSAHVAQMPAKGRLTKIAFKRYGYRKDLRREALERLFIDVKRKTQGITTIKSDECPRYPYHVKKHFPDLAHETSKGRRACVVGQGELKAGGFDPLFSLNHTCAMFRDHLKRLTRRTWCTTKKKERLQDLLDIYVTYHNAKIVGARRLVTY